MMRPNTDRRSAGRSIIGRGALLFFDGQPGTRGCSIVDFSHRGVKLRTHDLPVLPVFFKLTFDNFITVQKCRLIWRKGDFIGAERSFRTSLALQPNSAAALSSLGGMLSLLRRGADAREQFEAALKVNPRYVHALTGLGYLAKVAGEFKEAEGYFRRALKVAPNSSTALAALAGLRMMTVADSEWLNQAKHILNFGLKTAEESELRFALGKYYDDVGDYEQAFRNYRRANALARSMAEAYSRDRYEQLANELIAAYPRPGVFSRTSGSNPSTEPVFVVGMPRSGTSLIEQIIASHPSAIGAGELSFWNGAMQRYGELRSGDLNAGLKANLANAYLPILRQDGEARRIVDKAPVNSDYMGAIHAVLPNARFIYVQRNPIDSCLSCYFQQFIATMNFTTDLADLVHYYRVHRRLIAHWREILPRENLLVVPYESLVEDQGGWTRRILEFLELDWSEGCMDFLSTQRLVATASFWQVRQKIFTRSVNRWRNYEKFIGPLLELKDLDVIS